MKNVLPFYFIIMLLAPMASGALDFSPASEFSKNCIVTPLPRLIKGPLPERGMPDAGGFRYVIRKPVITTGLYFQVSYESTEPVQLILEFRKGPVMARGLLPGRHTAAVYIDRETDLVSFTIQSRNRNIPPKVLAAGTVPEPSALCDLKFYEKTVEIQLEPGAGGAFGHFDISGQAVPETRGDLRITVLGDKERRADYRLTILPGVNRFYLYKNQIGFTPQKVILESDLIINLITGGSFTIPKPADQAIPADANTIAEWDSDLWRRSDFEIFSWSVTPDIYILSFRDNKVQWDYLTRLSFHQEKRHSRGSLLSDETLKGRQGWNAHDYGAEGLAAFYNQAVDENFRLNRRELILRDTLLSLGVIRTDAQGRFIPGTGAIISLDNTRPREDKLFYLNHELAHGIFFTDPLIRREVAALWNSESEDFQFMFKAFLWENSYDTSYEYLVINEYYGYLNQMPVAEMDSYFNWKVTDLFPSRSANGKKVRRIIWSDNKQFSRSAARIEKITFKYYGLRAGRFQCLRRL